tara:strand:+ start:2054 stop:2485 length:432 start_codon:yes stop_codon:yes gene_type:complete
MSKSNYLENEVLNLFLKGGAHTQLTGGVFLGIISDANPTDSSVTEISAGSYTATSEADSSSRPPITFGTISTSNNVTSASGPTSDIEFENTSGSAFTVRGFAVYDAATSGDLLYYGELAADKEIADGDSIRFEAPSSITITEA